MRLSTLAKYAFAMALVVFCFWSFEGGPAVRPLTVTDLHYEFGDALSTLPRIAVAITITEVRAPKPGQGGFLDAAAVLAQSVRDVKFSYPVHLVAIIHPNASSAVKDLHAMGFKTLIRDLPFRVADIRKDYYRKQINGGGCCGALELLKLEAYRMTEYHKVLHLDADTVLLQNIDSLIAEERDFLYTKDYPMMPKNGKYAPVQGGFLLIKPNVAVFEELVEIVLDGDFRDGRGWGEAGIGWWWGGATIQGLLPYYYYTIAPPSASRDLPVCEYNAMDPETCKENLDKVKSGHFTICQKPFECSHGRAEKPLCVLLHDHWWQVRDRLALRNNAEVTTPGKARDMCEKDGKWASLAPASGIPTQSDVTAPLDS